MVLGWWLCVAAGAGPGTWAAEISERQVTFKGADGTDLAGTLQLPAGASNAKVPALVLLAGSGPTNRDGNQPPILMTDLLKQIAHGLEVRGVATLRFDKRGMDANAAELPKNPNLYGAFFSWENFVGDAAAACRFLREQPEVDPARTGILGHSEGGLLALAAAGVLQSDNHPVAALILISTPGRPIDAIIIDQLQGLLKQQGATPAQSDYFLEENHRITDAIRTSGQVPLDVPAGLAALYPSYAGRFLQSELAIDPCRLAAAFGGPVLVINGALDTQVSPERDAEALNDALKGRTGDDHTLIIVPGASHNLKVAKAPGDPGITGEVAPDVLNKLEAWVTAKLDSRATNK